MSYSISMFIVLAMGFGAVIWHVWSAEQKERKENLNIIKDPELVLDSESTLLLK